MAPVFVRGCGHRGESLQWLNQNAVGLAYSSADDLGDAHRRDNAPPTVKAGSGCWAASRGDGYVLGPAEDHLQDLRSGPIPALPEDPPSPLLLRHRRGASLTQGQVGPVDWIARSGCARSFASTCSIPPVGFFDG